MSPRLHKLLKSLLPEFILNRRRRRLAGVFQRQAEIEAHLFTALSGIVADGPFKGMKYISQACCSMLGPKLLGCYEKELSDAFETSFQRHYSLMVDIGAAEGYFAVGFLTRSPETRVVAFDEAAQARDMLETMASLNGVSHRLEIKHRCEISDLVALNMPAFSTLVVCDAEGAEKFLLDPSAAPSLLVCDIIVEVHDYMDLEIGSTLLGRFSSTHKISKIRTKPRLVKDLPRVEGFSTDDLLVAAHERRPCDMEWYWMEANLPR